MKAFLLSSLFALASADGHMGYVNYTADGVAAMGYMAHATACTSSAKCPAIAVIPDWNGIDSYEMERAHMLAHEGYFAFVVDIYGVEIVNSWGDSPGTSDFAAAANMHRQNATLFMAKMIDGLTQMASYSEVDTTKMAAIGYCFGGTGVLNLAMAGHGGMYSIPSGLLGVVSYHAGETGLIEPQDSMSHPKVSIHTGFSDQNGILPDTMATWADAMENHSMSYEVSWYGSGVGHGFTVFGGNSYHMIADNSSWDQTLTFLDEMFDDSIAPQMAPMSDNGITTITVHYTLDGENYTGYMAWDADHCTASSPCPGVAIVHDWTGLDDYEKHRAEMIAENHFVAFAMDIYGDATIASWGGNPQMSDYSMASTMHRQNASLYMSKIHAGISLMASQAEVNADAMAVIGYCFGGTGAINVGLAGHGGTYGFPTGVLAAISYHGGETGLISVDASATSYPMVAIHNGYADPFGISATTMKDMETAMEAEMIHFENSWYGSSVMHGFTEWSSDAYHVSADLHSWTQTITMLETVLMGDADSMTTMPPADDAAMDGGDVTGSAQVSTVPLSFAMTVVAVAFSMFH